VKVSRLKSARGREKHSAISESRYDAAAATNSKADHEASKCFVFTVFCINRLYILCVVVVTVYCVWVSQRRVTYVTVIVIFFASLQSSFSEKCLTSWLKSVSAINMLDKFTSDKFMSFEATALHAMLTGL